MCVNIQTIVAFVSVWLQMFYLFLIFFWKQMNSCPKSADCRSVFLNLARTPDSQT